MIAPLDWIGRQVLFSVDPETAHSLSIAALRSGLPLCGRWPESDALRVSAAGLDFPNPIGMAAGYDKNAEVPDALLGLGFGFAEVGTVTPLPQQGNPKPRVFRLRADEGVINRLGFNNEGHKRSLGRMRDRAGRPGIVGVNIGANRDSADRIADYELGVSRFANFASYLTVNISSPNTPGLRDLQSRANLAALLSRVAAARHEAVGSGRRLPIFLKIAPDLDADGLAEVAGEVLAHGIDGIVVSNTTTSRDGLKSAFAIEAGGLSGKPLFVRSTVALARLRKLVGPDLTLVGTGGVDTAEAAIEKIRAGADLVQLYTSMIYAGPSLPGRIVAGLARHVDALGLNSLRGIRDSSTDDWADRPV